MTASQPGAAPVGGSGNVTWTQNLAPRPRAAERSCHTVRQEVPISALAATSRATGVIFLAGFGAVATGPSSPAVVAAFWFALVVAWTWLATLAVHLYRQGRGLIPFLPAPASTTKQQEALQ